MKTGFKTTASAAAFLTALAIVACASPPAEPQSAGPALAIKAQDPSLKWGPCPPILTGECNIAVLHGDPSRPNADVFLRVGAGYVIANHIHTSAERMILVSGKLQVQYKGAAPVVLSPSDYAYGPSKAPHGGKCISSEPCTLFIAFEGPIDAEAFTGALD